MYGALPKNEKTFSIDVDGSITGIKYTGQFTTKCILSIGEKHKMEMEKTRLMGGYSNPSDGLFGIADTLAMIQSHLITWPDWYINLKTSDILDENVILAIYNGCVKAGKDWQEEVKALSKPTKTVQPVDQAAGNV